MIIVSCPACRTRRVVDYEELALMMQCSQFMCWSVCGMDVPIFGPLMVQHIRLNPEEEEE